MKKRVMAVLLLVVILVGTCTAFSFAEEKKTGLYKEDGQWKYFENGTFTKVTGLDKRPDNNTWHYVENGIYKKVTGLVQCVQPGSSKGKWYYVVKGDMDKTASGLVQCVQPGKSKGKWYYVNKGKLVNTAAATGLVQCIQPGGSNGKWYYVKDGKQSQETGLVQCVQPNSEFTGKWYYVKKGKLNTSATGVVKCIQPGQSEGKLYYVKNGSLDKTYNGKSKGAEDGKSYTVKNGKVIQQSDNTINVGPNRFVKVNGEWLYYEGGWHDSWFIGLAPSEKNGKLYCSTYYSKGKIDWDYTGADYSYDGKRYFVKNGAVDYTANGLVVYTNSIHDREEAVYCKNGAVDTGFTGFIKDKKTGKLYYLDEGLSGNITNNTDANGNALPCDYAIGYNRYMKYPGTNYMLRVNDGEVNCPEYSYEVSFLKKPRLGGTTFFYLKTKSPYAPSVRVYHKDGAQLRYVLNISMYASPWDNPYDDLTFEGEAKGINSNGEEFYPEGAVGKVKGGYLYDLSDFEWFYDRDKGIDTMEPPEGDYYIEIYEDSTGRSVLLGPIRFDYEWDDKKEWMQGIIDKTYKSGMTKEQHLRAICNYMNEISVYQYDNYTLELLMTPNWKMTQPQYDSYTSPYEIENFGRMIGYPVESCYYWYEEGTPQWRTWHAYAYSKKDDKYFMFCPSSNKVGNVPVKPIDFANYNYYKTLKYTPK